MRDEVREKTEGGRQKEESGRAEPVSSSFIPHAAALISSCHVGCQGWNYGDWVTGPGGRVFYPQGTRAADMLEIYARAFETVEVDSTFYAIPPTSVFEGWAKRTPHGFTFSLKLPREVTHERALGAGSAELTAEFCDRARALEEKLACVLIQLPPQFELNRENGRALRRFLPRLPRDISFQIEFRSSDWLKETVFRFLSEHSVGVALVEGQWLGTEETWALAERPIAPSVYVRWMGARNLTCFDRVERPQDENLAHWGKLITRLGARAERVFAYFSNFYEGHAPASANKLKRILGQKVVEAADLEDQPSLF